MRNVLSFNSTIGESGSFIKPAQSSVTARAFSLKCLAQRSISDTPIGAPEN
jgi:hypothetical protein